jgi:indole-3-glycerol phosphate synthase
MDTLEKIVAHKRTETARRMELYPVKLLEKSVYFNTDTVSLSKYLMRPDKNGIIAEIKRHSPSKGYLNKYVNVERTSIGYMQAGASALSVLTEHEFFKGSSEDLITARKFNFCPILRKDFILEEYQVIESRSIGADAILLIAAILSKARITTLTRLAHSLGMEVLLELHGEDELDKISGEINVIGVNNRDLKSLNIDISTSFRMAELIPSGRIMVSESGIEDSSAIEELKAAGFNGFLIGSYFMKHPRPELACRKLISELNTKKPQTLSYGN